jgi:TonB family protein
VVTAPVIAVPNSAPPVTAEAPSTAEAFVKTGLASSTVKGSLPKEVIHRIVHRHVSEVKFCYEKDLLINPNLAGRVTVQFVVSGNGQVLSAVVAKSTLGSQTVENCIVEAVRRWTFPSPEDGGIVTVVYPFEFKSK